MNDLKILLVDDNNEAREAIHTILKCKYPNCDITEGNDGEELLAHVERAHEIGTRFDLYFTDHNMPNLNGLEAVKELREKGDMTPVVFYTSEVEMITPHLEQLKNSYCIYKICEIKELREIIETAVSSSQTTVTEDSVD